MSAIRKLLAGGQVVAYYPALARAVGGIAPALFLQQVAHWDATSNDGWVYRTQEELEEELAMSPKTQATCRKHLVDGGFLLEERRAKNRLHYKVQWDKVEATLQSLPTGKSRPAQRESLDLPNGRNSLEENNNKSKKEEVVGAKRPEEQETPLPDDVTTRCLLLLKDVKGFPRNHAENALKLAEYRDTFPQAEPEEVVSDFAAVVTERPFKQGDNPRLKLRNFFKSAHKRASANSNVTPLKSATRRPWHKDEPLNPQSDEAIALRDRPNAAGWYEAFYDVDADTVERLLKKHTTHSAMLDALERGVASA